MDFICKPQPAKNNLSILFTVTKAGRYSIQLTSVSGDVVSVHKTTATAGANMMDINISNYANGNYFVTLSGDSKSKTITIVKAQ
jgi:type IX secretion system substrate protein